MKTKQLLLLVLMMIVPMISSAKKLSFTIGGPEDSYNRICVVNETSQENFNCRLVILDDNDEKIAVYGVYHLKSEGDEDSNSSWIGRGARIGIQMPKDFPLEVSFSVEYYDRPFYDYIIIRLYDNTTEFDE